MEIDIMPSLWKFAISGLALALFAGGSADAAPKAWKPVKKELKNAGWTPKYPPSTDEYEPGTVWIARKEGNFERFCGGGVNAFGERLPSAFRNTLQMAAVNEVQFFDVVKARRELDLGLMAGIAPGALVENSPASAKIAVGYKRVRAYSVNYGTVRTYQLTVDYSPGGAGFVDGIRDEECFSMLRALRNRPDEIAQKIFKSLVVVTGAMEADALEINWELNPTQDSPAAAAETAAASGAPADAAGAAQAAVAAAGSATTTSPGAEAPTTPESGGGEGASDKKPTKPAAPDATVKDSNLSKCGFYMDLSGPVVSGANLGARVQICNRNTLRLAFDEPQFIAYQARRVTDWIAESGSELTGKRSGFKLRNLREAGLPSLSDAELALARRDGLIP